MKPFFLPIIAALAASVFPLHAQNLVTNGDFETGGNILGGSPFAWNTTLGPAGTGQFNPVTLDPPGPPASAPLSGNVGYMNTGTQIFQTFTGVKLQPGTTYTISFDAYVTVGFVNEEYPQAYFLSALSYGTGSGGTSGFNQYIKESDLKIGPAGYNAPLTTTAQTFTHSFTTKSIAEGFEGTNIFGVASDIAIFMQPVWGPNAAQAYIDNVSVTATPVTYSQLVTNGDFETGGNILGASPFAWKSTVGPAGTGQFNPVTLDPPGPPASAPLSGSVGYMNTGTQVFQTFAGVKLQPSSTYIISFDAYVTVGFVNEEYPQAYFLSAISYGTGSSGTSGFNGYIADTDLKIGPAGYNAPLTTTAQTFTHTFTTKSIAEGFVGDGTKDIAIYMQPVWGPNAAQAYIDNVSVLAIVPSEDAAAPVLSITRSGSNVILSWPENVSGWTLESSTDLGINDGWDPVPFVSNNSVTVPLNGSKDFFRLKKN